MQCTVRPRHGVSGFVPLCCVAGTNQVRGVTLSSKVGAVLVSHAGQVGGTLVHRSVISGTCYQWHTLSVPQEPPDGVTCGAGDTRGPCCRQGDEDRSVAFPWPEGCCPQPTHIPGVTLGRKSGYKHPLSVLSLDIQFIPQIRFSFPNFCKEVLLAIKMPSRLSILIH